MPRYITKLSPACFLRLDSNPLQEPPWEIAKKGIEAIARYFEQPSAIIFDSNKAIKIRNGVPTQEDASEVNPEPYSNHDFVTDTAVVGLLHSSVTRINLGGCHLVTDETIHAIARNCKSLKSINVSTCHKVTDGGLVDLAKRCRHLKSIDVALCRNLKDETIRAIARNCRSLESLDVFGWNSQIAAATLCR
jgi:bacterioferritin-associated ferredoxin